MPTVFMSFNHPTWHGFTTYRRYIKYMETEKPFTIHWDESVKVNYRFFSLCNLDPPNRWFFASSTHHSICFLIHLNLGENLSLNGQYLITYSNHNNHLFDFLRIFILVEFHIAADLCEREKINAFLICKNQQDEYAETVFYYFCQ
jgi:hypothetical protein